MFHFVLHPLQMLTPEDFSTVFKAEPLSEDTFLVSWEEEDGFEAVTYTSKEVEMAIQKGYWIKSDENGEH